MRRLIVAGLAGLLLTGCATSFERCTDRGLMPGTPAHGQCVAHLDWQDYLLGTALMNGMAGAGAAVSNSGRVYYEPAPVVCTTSGYPGGATTVCR